MALRPSEIIDQLQRLLDEGMPDETVQIQVGSRISKVENVHYTYGHVFLSA